MPEDELFAKAQDMGIKIWSIEKVDRVLNELLDGNSPTKSASSKAPSLPHLLRAEQLSGITLERDPDIERPDYNYFSPRSYYILVEDASGEHRTVIAKEYDRPRRGDNGEWPILHGGVEGRVAFTAREQAVPPLPKGNSRPTVKQPARPAAAANTLLAPPKPSHNGGGNGLRRSASLNNFNKSLVGSFNKRLASAAAADFLSRKKTLPDAAAISGEQDANAAPEEYVAASGNSQPLTSNIASVTSGAPYSAQPHGNTQAGVMLDARLAQLNKRQILINRVGLGQQNSLPVPNPRPGKLGSNARRTSAEGLKNKNPAKPNEPVKPGYCENCRVRYEDFKDVGTFFRIFRCSLKAVFAAHSVPAASQVCTRRR